MSVPAWVDSLTDAVTLVLVTDFIEWLSGNEPNGFEDAYALYKAVEGESMGPYKSTKDDAKGHVYIKGPEGPSLALVSEKAREYFVRLIRRRYMDGDGPEAMAPEGWYYFMHSMSKDD